MSPAPLYACLYQPPWPGQPAVGIGTLLSVAQEFSPRYERYGDDLVSIDVCGLGRLLGPAQIIGEELRREAARRGVRVHVALAATCMAALVLARARPGLTLVEPGGEAATLAPLPIGILEKIQLPGVQKAQGDADRKGSRFAAISAVKHWGVKTLGDLAALPPGDVAARLGQAALFWSAVARGEDARPLVPTLPEERFISSLDLEWPIEGLEPLSFVLTRLLEPLATRLERRDRGAAVLHVELGLVTRCSASMGRGQAVEPREIYARHLQLPAPIRDVRTLRTLALLDLDAHPPPAAVDRVTIAIDPTPGRVLQHRLFTRAHPTPDRLSTLVARLGALMGHDRIGRPASVDSHRPGAFQMQPFPIDHIHNDHHSPTSAPATPKLAKAEAGGGWLPVVSALRRCRPPVPARVAVADGRPLRVTTDRRGFAGGAVIDCAGPWRTSGEWWEQASTGWNRDEWDVAMKDGAVYCIFRDRNTEGWFIDAIVD